MKSRLVDATLDCLQEYGYHGTSLSRILETAGASRGAWRHHFASKVELVAEAGKQSLFRDGIELAETIAPKIATGEYPLPKLVDFIWENFYQGRSRNVWVELTVASRTDKQLQELMKPVFSSFVNSLDKIWRIYFKTPCDSSVSVEMVLNLTLYVIGGMGLQSIVHDNPAYYQALRSQWTTMLAPLIQIKRMEKK